VKELLSNVGAGGGVAVASGVASGAGATTGAAEAEAPAEEEKEEEKEESDEDMVRCPFLTLSLSAIPLYLFSRALVSSIERVIISLYCTLLVVYKKIEE
jgi:hypothetical protein